MAKQKFYDFTSVIAEEMEALLIKLKSLISAKKITDNLPENLQGEIDEINDKIENIKKLEDIFTSGVDGGEYYDETLTIKLINLVQNGSFEDMSNWTTWLTSSTDSSQQKYGKHSLKLGGDTLNGDALASTAIEKPIAGHKYYGREYLKTNGELTAADCRFEIISTDIVPEEAHIFGWNQGNHPDWTMISDVITIPYANADSYIVRTFTVGGSVEAWVDGLMVIDLTATFGEGNEPSKEWCDTNIPFFEGGKKAYIDFNNSIRFISDLHKITILSDISSWNLGYANIIIENIKYTTESKEIYVPDGTVIKCEVSGAYSIGANDSGTGLIIINGQEIVSAYGCTKTYDYIVRDDLTIRLNKNGGFGSSSYGMITIDELNVGHIHFYDDWGFDNETYHSKNCVCGDVISEKHEWDSGIVTVEPTSTTAGVMTYTCSVCGGTKTEEIGIISLEVEKQTLTTYAGETEYANESFILLDIYPKDSNSIVKVTYGGLTKTLEFSGTNAQQVYFGTFNGVSDNVETPASGTLIIEGACGSFAVGAYQSSSKSTSKGYCSCITNVNNWGIVNYIPNYAFRGCSALALISLPSSITSIGHYAFYECINLALTSLPSGITTIGRYAFYRCVNIDVRNMPSNLTSIGECAFDMWAGVNQGNNIHSLEAVAMYNATIVLPSGIQIIDNKAFIASGEYVGDDYSYYTYIGGVKILATTPPNIGKQPFGSSGRYYSSNSYSYPITITVPKGCGEAYKTAEGWSSYADYIVEVSE